MVSNLPSLAASRRAGRGGGGLTRVGLPPAQSDSGVANRVPLHLSDGHFGRVSRGELNKPTAFTQWDLHVGDVTEGLEVVFEIFLGDDGWQATDEHSGVVWISELVQRRLPFDWPVALSFMILTLDKELYLEPKNSKRTASVVSSAKSPTKIENSDLCP
ncbi:hypothetical protein WICPIJ_010129 [Wickerhamomyces pijperi]|uniref:Uncharacterized protein n=1 Tax=Wickerhamomyces pijperi TaxID=599730 RepID=A0A9P8PI95_WICPI|nr:hypothetical protein WICPIJ_010129 [Wickerhamomyces pijperi]